MYTSYGPPLLPERVVKMPLPMAAAAAHQSCYTEIKYIPINHFVKLGWL